jgi:hypothetical protein
MRINAYFTSAQPQRVVGVVAKLRVMRPEAGLSMPRTVAAIHIPTPAGKAAGCQYEERTALLRQLGC